MVIVKRSKFLPKVSIIMNCLNGEKFIHDSIKSIIKQNYKNWEIIFFDNNSSDNSKKIFLSFSDKRLKYFKSKKVLKLYKARNQAIKKAKGKFICFLDVDDLWNKNKLSQQIKYLQNNRNCKILYSNYIAVNEIKNKNYKPFDKLLPHGDITKQLLNEYTISILTTMIDAKVFKENKFKENYSIIGDFDFFIRMSKKYKIHCIQKYLAYYRIHSSNFSTNKIKQYIEELSHWIYHNKKNFEKKSLNLKSIKLVMFKLRVKYFLKLLGV